METRAKNPYAAAGAGAHAARRSCTRGERAERSSRTSAVHRRLTERHYIGAGLNRAALSAVARNAPPGVSAAGLRPGARRLRRVLDPAGARPGRRRSSRRRRSWARRPSPTSPRPASSAWREASRHARGGDSRAGQLPARHVHLGASAQPDQRRAQPVDRQHHRRAAAADLQPEPVQRRKRPAVFRGRSARHGHGRRPGGLRSADAPAACSRSAAPAGCCTA